MDKEITILKKTIVEKELTIKKITLQYEEYEKNKGQPKGKNERFCELYQSFSKKILLPIKIDMIIGMYLKRYGDELEKTNNKLMQEGKILKKRINELTEELQLIKYSKKYQNNVEENKNEIIVDENGLTPKKGGEFDKMQLIEAQGGTKGFRTVISNRAYGQGITRTVNVGSVTKEIGNAIITTKTTQISYKRKRVEDIKEQE